MYTALSTAHKAERLPFNQRHWCSLNSWFPSFSPAQLPFKGLAIRNLASKESFTRLLTVFTSLRENSAERKETTNQLGLMVFYMFYTLKSLF